MTTFLLCCLGGALLALVTHSLQKLGWLWTPRLTCRSLSFHLNQINLFASFLGLLLLTDWLWFPMSFAMSLLVALAISLRVSARRR